MDRYSIIPRKTTREIVLLKGSPCRWGRCSFCDFIDGNSSDADLCNDVNRNVLRRITGQYGILCDVLWKNTDFGVGD